MTAFIAFVTDVQNVHFGWLIDFILKNVYHLQLNTNLKF